MRRSGAIMRSGTMAFVKSIALAAVTALLAGCGGGGTHPHASADAFAWLRPAPPAPGWSTARLAGGVVMAYPRSWRRIHSDPGTASAALEAPDGDLVVDYLNATPQQGEETLRNWSTFRPEHNGEEGDSHIDVLAKAAGLRFRDGHGSCVIDRYRTPRASYQEIACLVRGPRSGNVIVGAALASRWAQEAPTLERAVSAFVS